MRVYAYMRASTKEQNAERAAEALNKFIESHSKVISASFIENESGAILQRPELFRLLSIAEKGDVILIEQVDRLSRLNDSDWQQLRTLIKSKGLNIVSLDLPTSHIILNSSSADDFTNRMMEAVNSMMLDMLATISRKDYEDRRRRQAEGIEIAKTQGKFKGRPDDTAKQERIKTLLQAKVSYSEIQKTIGCSRGIIAKVSKKLKEGAL